MPSGVFAANAACLSIAAMAHKLVCAADALASLYHRLRTTPEGSGLGVDSFEFIGPSVD
jgi:hypothetical protein